MKSRNHPTVVHMKACEISGSAKWSKLLDTMESRVRFEDGYLQGWMDALKSERNRRRTITPRKGKRK